MKIVTNRTIHYVSGGCTDPRCVRSWHSCRGIKEEDNAKPTKAQDVSTQRGWSCWCGSRSPSRFSTQCFCNLWYSLWKAELDLLRKLHMCFIFFWQKAPWLQPVFPGKRKDLLWIFKKASFLLPMLLILRIWETLSLSSQRGYQGSRPCLTLI